MINRHIFSLFFLFSLTAGTHLFAQKDKSITEIKVEVSGLGNVSEGYIFNNIRIKKGDDYVVDKERGDITAARVNQDIVRLMKTGRFEDVQVQYEEDGPDGIRLVFKVRAFPMVTDIKVWLHSKRLGLRESISDNEDTAFLMDSEYLSIKESKLRKELKLVKGQQYNDARKHSDEKVLEEQYLKKGFYPVKVKGVRVGASVWYIINEGEKFKIDRGELGFESVTGKPLSFSEKELKKYVKIRQRRSWYNPVSWFLDDGRLKPREYQEDIDRLERYYRDQGYLDVNIDITNGADKVLDSSEYKGLRENLFNSRKAHSKAVDDLSRAERRLDDKGEGDNESELERLVDAAESKLDDVEDDLDDVEDEFEDYMDEMDRVSFVFSITEGPQYKVGDLSFKYGRRVDGRFQEVSRTQFPEFKPVIAAEVLRNMLSLKEGEAFRPGHIRVEDPGDSDQEIVEDAYGRRAFIDAAVTVQKTTDLKNDTINLLFEIIEGDHFFEDDKGSLKWDRNPVNVGLVKIEGNAKTKDFVIRRELAISPGEPFDLGKMENSRRRIEGLRLFKSVRARPEYSEQEPGSTTENLVVSVKEENTGRFQVGGGFSTDYGAFAHVIVAQENFDIMRWRRPYFAQGGGQKVRLKTTAGGEINNHELDFEEPWLMGRKLRFTTSIYTKESQYYHDKFDVEETGVRLGLERAMFGNESFRGRVHYTIEDVGLVDMKDTASTELLAEKGNNLISMVGTGLTYDTRGGGIIPTKGQRSSADLDYAPSSLGSEKDFYSVHLKSAWYFQGLREGHNIEFLTQAGVVDSTESDQKVPYLYRNNLGGSRNLRGYDYREVGPRGSAGDYLGGNTMVHATVQYSVQTPIEMLRVATFYDVGVVNADSYDFALGNYNDDFGVGFVLQIPFLGPVRIDYAIPLTDDGHNGGGGRFNINMGYVTTF